MRARTAGLLILALVGCTAWLMIAQSKQQPHPAVKQNIPAVPKPSVAQQSAVEQHSTTAQQSVDRVTVRGKDIQVNVTTADEAFEVLTKSDETPPAVTSVSPIIPGGMVVVHTYKIAGRALTVEFARDSDSGPYMVKGILATPSQ